MKTISIIDSHTGGEPPLVTAGGPELGNGPLSEARRPVARSPR
jgi:4-hydroxyproline epimerase